MAISNLKKHSKAGQNNASLYCGSAASQAHGQAHKTHTQSQPAQEPALPYTLETVLNSYR